jgi:hypothetical protein
MLALYNYLPEITGGRAHTSPSVQTRLTAPPHRSSGAGPTSFHPLPLSVGIAEETASSFACLRIYLPPCASFPRLYLGASTRTRAGRLGKYMSRATYYTARAKVLVKAQPLVTWTLIYWPTVILYVIFLAKV